MQSNAGHINLQLVEENGNVILSMSDKKLLFPNQTVVEINNLLIKNFTIVKNYYSNKVPLGEVEPEDIELISLDIVLHYLYMYNMWRGMYKKQENRKLEFDDSDFDHPQTHDKINWFFKAKYPEDYITKCSLLLGMTEAEHRQYDKDRHAFHNMF